MKTLPLAAFAAAPALLLAVAASADNAASVNVRTAMVEGVNPAALAIWDVGNALVDDDDAPDPAQLDAERLAALKEAAQMLAVYARELADAGVIQAAGPDLVGGAVPDGVASRAQIQAAIDADPAGFRDHARTMGEEAEALVAAVDAGDNDAAAQLAATFDGACQSCHERYWYVQP